MRRTGYTIIALLLLIAQTVNAQTDRPESNTYRIPTDVQAVGGGEAAKSTLYILDDTIGEPNIGASRSDVYDLNAGYRQTVAPAYLALGCSDVVSLGNITLTGQRTGSGTCTVVTDADAGYSLSWMISTGSGGTNTGYLINELENVIAPLYPTVAGTPQTWSVTANDARWGARLRSTSTDTDAKWGTDNSTDKWLNVGTGSYTVVTRTSRTTVEGSTQVLQFRAEVGAQKIQPPGTYKATVTLTASAL